MQGVISCGERRIISPCDTSSLHYSWLTLALLSNWCVYVCVHLLLPSLSFIMKLVKCYHYVPGNVWSTLCILTYLIITITFQGRYFNYLHYTHEENEAELLVLDHTVSDGPGSLALESVFLTAALFSLSRVAYIFTVDHMLFLACCWDNSTGQLCDWTNCLKISAPRFLLSINWRNSSWKVFVRSNTVLLNIWVYLFQRSCHINWIWFHKHYLSICSVHGTEDARMAETDMSIPSLSFLSSRKEDRINRQ